jgi:hypothetical protein
MADSVLFIRSSIPTLNNNNSNEHAICSRFGCCVGEWSIPWRGSSEGQKVSHFLNLKLKFTLQFQKYFQL